MLFLRDLTVKMRLFAVSYFFIILLQMDDVHETSAHSHAANADSVEAVKVHAGYSK